MTSQKKLKLTIALLLLAVCICSCSPPGGQNYPYGMFDKDVKTFLDICMQGDLSGLKPEDLVRDDDGQYLLYPIWGKINDYQIIKTVHVSMNAYYFIEIKTEKEVKKYRVSYHPTLGRVEIRLKKISKN